MAESSTTIETRLADGLSNAEQWLTDNSDLFIQYGVNIISALVILFIGQQLLKAVANSRVTRFFRRRKWTERFVEDLSMA